MRGSTSSRAYRRLLRLAPRRLRDRHASEMEALFLDELAQARERGRVAAALLWCGAALDVLAESMRRRARRGVARVRPSKERKALMLGSDFRYAARQVSRARLSSALVVSMLALGIAANVAVFSLVNGLFLRPFPFPEPDRLVWINEKAPRWNLQVVGVNYPDFHQWRREQRLFQGLALYDQASFNLSDGSRAERVDGAVVTHDFASVLGIRPILGRTFTPEEDRPRGPAVVVIGQGLWHERFGGAADVLGRTLRLNGVGHAIVGVLPPEAEFPDGARLWVPMAGDPDQEGQSYGATGVGRLRPGVAVADAEKDLLRAHAPIWDARDPEKVVSPYLRPLRDVFVSDFQAAASTLSVAVALLLIVACANVACVMLARALSRRRELAIRVAVGADRWRLLRQLFAENAILSAAGGAAGVVAGRWGIGALVATVPDDLPRWAQFGLDGRVVAFSVAATLATALLFGWAPALHALRTDLREAMHTAAGGTTALPRGRRTLWLLVGAEFALSALLLVTGGLLLRAWDRVRAVDPGFRPESVATFSLSLPGAGYPEPGDRLAFWERLLERLEAVPGVATAGAVTCPPFGCHWGSFFAVEGRTPPPGAPNPVVLYRYASPGYFRTLGLRLRSGRAFDAVDGREGGARTVVVNETFARTFWPGEPDVVGKRLRRASSDEDVPWHTVVGLVADVKHYGLERPMRPGIYLPLPEEPPSTLTLALHARVDPAAVVGAARAVVREMDPDLALFQVQTTQEALRRSLRTRASYSWLLAVLAALSLVLALGGAYGVTAYLATQRTRELGIRVALGARLWDVVETVLRGGFRVVAAGVVVGVGLSVAAGRLLSSLLFGVAPHDAGVLASAVAVLLAAGAAAHLVPAWRAARVDPMSTLRTE